MNRKKTRVQVTELKHVDSMLKLATAASITEYYDFTFVGYKRVFVDWVACLGTVNIDCISNAPSLWIRLQRYSYSV